MIKARGRRARLAAIALTLLMTLLIGLTLVGCGTERGFDGERAYKHVETLCDLGPRPVDSEANREARDYIAKKLDDYGWDVERQEFAHRSKSLANIVARRGEGPIVIIGTHYDTRPLSDRDPVDRSLPVIGANDGASGVAVLLELARVLDLSATDDMAVWLVFFDGKDRAGIDDWRGSVGAYYMADEVKRVPEWRPEMVLIVDMVGDEDQQFYFDWNSSLWLQERIWQVAEELGYGAFFIPSHRHVINDDHLPFLTQGIPAASVVDLDYPYWRTRYDTVDKISADSLQRVGDVLKVFLEGEPLREGSIGVYVTTD